MKETKNHNEIHWTRCLFIFFLVLVDGVFHRRWNFELLHRAQPKERDKKKKASSSQCSFLIHAWLLLWVLFYLCETCWMLRVENDLCKFGVIDETPLDWSPTWMSVDHQAIHFGEFWNQLRHTKTKTCKKKKIVYLMDDEFETINITWDRRGKYSPVSHANSGQNNSKSKMIVH